MSAVAWAGAALLAAFAVFALVRLLSGPVKLALRLLTNAALGFLGVWVWNLLSPLHLGLNLATGSLLAVLGLPGFGLLVLLRWVLT